MASEYFGLKGKLVKEYQQVLNGLGANVKVNGKWNKKTEAAFNQYRDQFLEAIGVKIKEAEANPYQMMDYATRSDEELSHAAQNAYGSLYAGEIEALERGARDQQAALQGQIDALEPEYQQKLGQLAEQYATQRQALSDQALSRGLGRSSYVTDLFSGSQKREMSDGQALASATEARKRSLTDSMTKVTGDLAHSTSRLLGERESKILSAIDEYRKGESDKSNQALQYNNTLLAQHRTQTEQTRQFEQQLKQAMTIARMKKK